MFISRAANVKQLRWLTRVSSAREPLGIPKTGHELRTTALAIEEHIRTTLMFLPLSSSGFLLNYSVFFCKRVSLTHFYPQPQGQRTNFVSIVQLQTDFWFNVPWCQVCLFRFLPWGVSLKNHIDLLALSFPQLPEHGGASARMGGWTYHHWHRRWDMGWYGHPTVSEVG